jgi:hypothetical protein
VATKIGGGEKGVERRLELEGGTNLLDPLVRKVDLFGRCGSAHRCVGSASVRGGLLNPQRPKAGRRQVCQIVRGRRQSKLGTENPRHGDSESEHALLDHPFSKFHDLPATVLRLHSDEAA